MISGHNIIYFKACKHYNQVWVQITFLGTFWTICAARSPFEEKSEKGNETLSTLLSMNEIIYFPVRTCRQQEPIIINSVRNGKCIFLHNAGVHHIDTCHIPLIFTSEIMRMYSKKIILGSLEVGLSWKPTGRNLQWNANSELFARVGLTDFLIFMSSYNSGLFEVGCYNSGPFLVSCYNSGLF